MADTHLSDVTSRLDSAISSAEAALRQTTDQQTNQLSEADYLLQLRNLEREFQEEETRLTAQDEIRQLERKLEEQQRRLEALRSRSENNASNTGPASLPTAAGSSRVSPGHVAPVPLDSLIGQMSGTAPSSQLASITQNSASTALHSHFESASRAIPSMDRINRDTEADIFLRPASSTVATHGKPLRIVDFISRLMPQEDRRVLSTADGQASLILDCGSKKPKLESISIAQWSIANFRIFNELLSRGRLSTPLAVREYLSYSIKVLELASKYTWPSILKYDDEFRVVQSVYGYAWSQDHYHLHEVILRPLPTAAPSAGAPSQQQRGSNGNGNGNSGSQRPFPSSLFATHTSDGSEICRNFNAARGCTRGDSCHFKHVCNRKSGNRPCEGGHRGCEHSALFQQAPQRQ